MIIFGTAKKRLGTIDLHEGNCVACSTPSLTLTIFQKYFHFFFIPMFPLKKVAEGKCRNCGREYEQDDLPTYVDEAVAMGKKEARTPLILFIGLALFIVFGIITTIRDKGKAKDALAYFADPHVNDLYVLPVGLDESFRYMVCKVEKVSADSLTFLVGEDGYMFRTGAKAAIEEGKIEKPDYFDGTITYARGTVKEMIEGEDILPIYRLE